MNLMFSKTAASAEIAYVSKPAYPSNFYQQLFMLLRCFIEDPKVASIAPTPQTIARQIARSALTENARLIMEWGVGTGAITKSLLELLPHDGRVLGCDTNSNLALFVGDELNDERFYVWNETAEDCTQRLIHRGQKVDSLITGIPMGNMADEVMLSLLDLAKQALKPGGRLLIYQTWLPPFFSCKRIIDLSKKDFTLIEQQRHLCALPTLQSVVLRASEK